MNTSGFFLSIQKTLAYFDQFCHPLSAEELYDFLWCPPERISWNDFLIILDSAVANGICVRIGAYYMLPGREYLFECRRKNLVIAEKKMRRARRAGKILSRVPFVRGIFVCNTVSAGWPTDKSDIDVFIVVRSGRLWLTRFLITGAAALFNMRRGKKQITDKICLSFYITDSVLNIESVRISEPDIYLVYWIRQLIPIFDEGTVFADFLTANVWTQTYISNQTGVAPFFHRDFTITRSGFLFHIKNFFEKIMSEKFGARLEDIFCAFQTARIERRPHGPAPAVVVNDSMLKFHETDRRQEFQNVWLNHLANKTEI